MDDTPKLAPMIASVLAAFAACAPVDSHAATDLEALLSPAMPSQAAVLAPSQAAILAIESKAAEPVRTRMAFGEHGPSWVQWLNQHKPPKPQVRHR